jgi:hypothetical protein
MVLVLKQSHTEEPPMTHQTQSTLPAVLPQAVLTCADEWTSRIIPWLPADLTAQAHALGAFQRQRAIASPTDLLRGLLAYGLGTTSFRQLGAWSVLTDLADISAKAWRQRLLQATPWLQWLLAQLLTHPTRPRWLGQRARGRIRLIDATMLARPGGTGAGWRVHTAYDLVTGRVDQVAVTDHYRAESLQHYHLTPGDVIVTDGGYGSRAAVGLLHAAQADDVLRIHLNSFPLEHADGRPFDSLAWLQQPGRTTRSVIAWCTARRVVAGVVVQTRHRVRVLAERLPPAARAAAERRLQRKASQHGRQVSTRGLFLASWMLLVTTLPTDQWSDDDVWQLYRARWQIERLFKRMKQLLRTHTIRCTTAASATATIYALLIAWVLMEHLAAPVAASLQPVEPVTPGNRAEPVSQVVVSIWAIQTLTLDTLRHMIMGQWSLARLEASTLRLRRFVAQRGRRRSQAQEMALQLAGLQPADGLR